jgi:hypothetical protein
LNGRGIDIRPIQGLLARMPDGPFTQDILCLYYAMHFRHDRLDVSGVLDSIAELVRFRLH